MKKVLKKIRFYICAIRCLALYMVMLIKWLFTPQSKNKIARLVATGGMKRAFSNNISIQGQLDPNADVIIINHCSLFDIVLIESLHEVDLCWIGKNELNGKLGFLGVMRYPRHITIDRSSKSSMLSMIRQSKKALASGRPIVIFPEGTRNKKDTMLEFKDGAKALAEVLKARVQPIVLTGIRETIDFSNHTLEPDTPIKINYLESFEVRKGNENSDNWYKDLHDTMNNIFTEEVKSLKKEGI